MRLGRTSRHNGGGAEGQNRDVDKLLGPPINNADSETRQIYRVPCRREKTWHGARHGNVALALIWRRLLASASCCS